MPTPGKPRVLVAMSGGVDSSVAAALLVREGYDVVGVTMKLFKDGGELPDRPCCSLDSVNDARRVAEGLGIPHYVLNLQDAFGHDVVKDFVSEYAAGRTPIPCVRCNTFTKFRDLLHKADASEARGTIDWYMTFPDGSVADAFSRIIPIGPDRCVYAFVLTPPPVPLEKLEGALDEQSRTLADELGRLRSILEDHER
jgi:tRNA-specific 2-thiouridylase